MPTHSEWCILTASPINNKTSYCNMNVGKLSNFFLLKIWLYSLLVKKIVCTPHHTVATLVCTASYNASTALTKPVSDTQV